MLLKLDMHVHSEMSFDSVQTVEDIVKECRRKGLDGVCICDHNVTRTGLTVYDGVLILPGVEVATDRGHLLGYLTEQNVEPTRDFIDAQKRIKAARGLAVLAHPFERVRDSREVIDARIDESVHLLDGLEAANSRADQFVREANIFARAAAMRNRMRTFAGSDAHLPCEVGGAYTEIEVDCESVAEITLEKLREAFLYNGAAAILRAESKRINTAKSQYIRMKKINAGAKKWCKYFLYAAKCIWYDIKYARKADRKENK